MVNRSAFGGFYKGRRVLVTGHTGFKGAWLSLWLQELGAKITGLSLPAERPSLFRQAQIDRITKSHFVDIQEALRTRKAILASKPEIVFHLAAQPLVRRSYREPGLTFATNVLGTFHVIQAARDAGARTIICATTDKCYDKPESGKAFVEEDPLGGHDPYSASKACAEIVAASFRDSFLGASRTSLSTARAGNVIGGGDWAEDRLIPDCVRAFTKGKPVIVRNPRAIRPWQHVLDPLSGYLWLAARQWDNPKTFSGAWNFAPSMSSGEMTVQDVTQQAALAWGKGATVLARPPRQAPHEAPTLRLNPAKAENQLGWRAAHSAADAVNLSIQWYSAARSRGFNASDFCRRQIQEHVDVARAQGAPWS